MKSCHSDEKTCIIKRSFLMSVKIYLNWLWHEWLEATVARTLYNIRQISQRRRGEVLEARRYKRLPPSTKIAYFCLIYNKFSPFPKNHVISSLLIPPLTRHEILATLLDQWVWYLNYFQTILWSISSNYTSVLFIDNIAKKRYRR